MKAELQLLHCTQVCSGETPTSLLSLFFVVNDYRTVPSVYLLSPFR